jgi:hypothetical protein
MAEFRAEQTCDLMPHVFARGRLSGVRCPLDGKRLTDFTKMFDTIGA